MPKKEKSETTAKNNAEDEIPWDFKKWEKPFGLEEHIFNIIFYGFIIHGATVYSLCYLFPLGLTNRMSLFFWMGLGYATSFGTTVGAHRYWCHRTYKAKLPLQIILMLMQTVHLQYPLYKWCRDHRVHHKHTDTHADPHSAATGFWFSHILWGFQPRHPDNLKANKTIYMKDLERDPIIRFQSKYYAELVVLLLSIQIYICHLVFPEKAMLHNIAGCLSGIAASLHGTFLVNSAAHYYGNRPYDKSFSSSDNRLVSLLALGEGFHNYHHTFPWDYKASEYGFYFNVSTLMLHILAKIGWAYDMKTVSHKMLVDRINRTGNGTHPLHNHAGDKNLERGDTSYSSAWGWGDKSISKADLEIAETRFPSGSGDDTYRSILVKNELAG